MSIKQMLDSRPITGITPFNELPIDADIWRQAHDHHHQHRMLHALSSHRPGVVYGLEVLSTPTPGGAIIVAPGVGIDSNGQVIVLRKPVRFELTKKGQMYVVLSYLEARDKSSKITIGGGDQYYRMVEGHELSPVDKLPSTPYLELARIYRTGLEEPVRNAVNSNDPDPDEINLLHRKTSFPHCYADIGVGEISYAPKEKSGNYKPNRSGLVQLLREGNGSGFGLYYHGIYNPKQDSDTDEPALLYVAGKGAMQPLSGTNQDGLRRYLQSGGVLFAEADGPGCEFTSSLQDLCKQIGANLQSVESGNPLLNEHYVFSAPPVGAEESGTVSADLKLGVVFSTRNFGAAWQGDIADPTTVDSRERIRQSVEFGLNITAWAAHRQRRAELQSLIANMP